MKKICGLSAAILFLALSVYFLAVLLFGAIFLTETTSRNYSANLIMPCVLIILIIGGIALCAYNYKHFRIGRFNSDIFTTIYLFLVFMISYTIDNTLIMDYVHFSEWFPFIWPIMMKFTVSGIGIFEATLFLATVCCGLTIGEDKNKKYYE